MKPDFPNGQTGYVLDDAEMIANFIKADWSIPVPILVKPIIFFDQDTDPDTFNFATGDIQCVVYADDITKTPMGIGFDGYSVERTIMISIQCMSRTKTIMATDEIERILAIHAIRPGNGWHLLYDLSDIPVKQGRKMYRRQISITLKAYWRPRLLKPSDTKCSDYVKVIKDDENQYL